MSTAKAHKAATNDLSEVELLIAQRRLEADLRSRIRSLESRYEIRSDQLEEAVGSGSIRETAEVAEWTVMWRTLRGLRSEGSPRLE